MSLKDNAQSWTIKEQVFEDPSTGLTFQFEVVEDDAESPYRLRIFGELPFGNREILFSAEGEQSGSGTFLAGQCKPTWATPL